MESPPALQENNTPYIAYSRFCTENQLIPKLPLQAKNSRYSESKTLFNVSQHENLKYGIGEQDFKETEKLPSEHTHNVSGDLKKEILIHNNRGEVLLKSNVNLTAKSEENSVSDLDSSTGVGKASSGYCTDTSEKEEIGTDENIVCRVATPLCSKNSSPASTAVNKVQAAESSVVNEVQVAESSAADKVQAAESSAHTSSRSRTRSYNVRQRSKHSNTEVPSSQFSMIGTDENIAHKVATLLCSENSFPPTSSSAANEVQGAESSAVEVEDVESSASATSRNTRRRSYSLRSRPKGSRRKAVSTPQQDLSPFDMEDPQEDLLPFDMEKLLRCDYNPVTSEEVYLKKLIQQLDSSYTKAVVVVTRLENMDPSLWRKYLGK